MVSVYQNLFLEIGKESFFFRFMSHMLYGYVVDQKQDSVRKKKWGTRGNGQQRVVTTQFQMPFPFFGEVLSHKSMSNLGHSSKCVANKNRNEIFITVLVFVLVHFFLLYSLLNKILLTTWCSFCLGYYSALSLPYFYSRH